MDRSFNRGSEFIICAALLHETKHQGGKMSVMTRCRCTVGLLSVLWLVAWMGGCASSSSNSPPPSQAALRKDAGSMPTYYDFSDVMVPSELTLVRGESFVYAASGTTAGVLTLKGRVDRDSLITFFDNNMAKDNWRMISSFSAPKAILLFQKDTRWCVISIEDGFWNEYVKVWVAPTLNGAGGGLTK